MSKPGAPSPDPTDADCLYEVSRSAHSETPPLPKKRRRDAPAGAARTAQEEPARAALLEDQLRGWLACASCGSLETNKLLSCGCRLCNDCTIGLPDWICARGHKVFSCAYNQLPAFLQEVCKRE